MCSELFFNLNVMKTCYADECMHLVFFFFFKNFFKLFSFYPELNWIFLFWPLFYMKGNELRLPCSLRSAHAVNLKRKWLFTSQFPVRNIIHPSGIVFSRTLIWLVTEGHVEPCGSACFGQSSIHTPTVGTCRIEGAAFETIYRHYVLLQSPTVLQTGQEP